ncbi:MAG: hypothetical protein HC896_16000 [Bacteroidales bacterium]|nr:hypothetical protein [Bacteroidales bacterium]
MVDKYYRELQQIKELHKETLAKARQEALQLLDSTNKKIEQVIREIKENQANKEKTRQLRQELEELKDQMGKPEVQKNKELIRRIKVIERHNPEMANDLKKELSQEATIEELQLGDAVKMVGQDTIGEIIEKTNQGFLVTFGQLITNVKASKLIKVGKEEARAGAKKQLQARHCH